MTAFNKFHLLHSLTYFISLTLFLILLPQVKDENGKGLWDDVSKPMLILIERIPLQKLQEGVAKSDQGPLQKL